MTNDPSPWLESGATNDYVPRDYFGARTVADLRMHRTRLLPRPHTTSKRKIKEDTYGKPMLSNFNFAHLPILPKTVLQKAIHPSSVRTLSRTTRITDPRGVLLFCPVSCNFTRIDQTFQQIKVQGRLVRLV